MTEAPEEIVRHYLPTEPEQPEDLDPEEEFEEDISDETANLAVFPDDPPKSGEWVDTDDVVAEPTEDELEKGRQLGEEIDVDDEDDTGLEDVEGVAF